MQLRTFRAVNYLMASTLSSRWQKLHHGIPGRRFRDRYEAHRRQRSEYPWIARAIRMLLALVAFAVGVVLMFIPGPAVLFYLIAGMLLASDSLMIARLLDKLEVRGRKVWKWALAHWRRMPLAGKIVVVLLALVSSAACTYFAYRFIW